MSRGIETAIEEGIEEMVVGRYRYQGGVEEGIEEIFFDRYRCRGTIHQMQEQKLNLSTSCREAIKEARAFSIYPLGIEKLSRL